MKLNDLKTKYQKVEPPMYLKMRGLDEVLAKMDGGNIFQKQIWYKRLAIAVFSILLIVGGMFGLYKVSLASTIGSPFYPVKKVVENVVEKVTGNKEIKVENRAKEIIHLSEEKEKNKSEFEETVKDYKQKSEEQHIQIDEEVEKAIKEIKFEHE